MAQQDLRKLTPCDLFSVINDESDRNVKLSLILCRSPELTDKQKQDNITLRQAIKRREGRIARAYHELFSISRQVIRQNKQHAAERRQAVAEELRLKKVEEELAYAELVAKRIRSRAELFVESARKILTKEQISAIWGKAEQDNPDHFAFQHICKKDVRTTD
ncbi:hypothetical protein AA14337_2973 [Acetobacter malorum DSM 14337]|uniref:Uncharacterized protein n=1 Tax=Acetobacter malorum DSM 14337 TaxID=1307910 RepID=A0ABQ0PYW3_9PROT|nr:hypothetical protein [Acetobacter malorum]KXV06729.1 hypothetical protein AD930_06400 [Acetobacter malorum]GBQ85022.1 hypothetical protein AA14337_2973 [Acetobacter malorum DSM 14337]